MKKVASFLVLFMAFLVLTGCGKAKKVVCSKDKALPDSSSKYTLTIKNGKVNKVEEEMIFYTAESASNYYNNMKKSEYDVKLENHSVIITYKNDLIVNRILVNDTKEKTVVKELEAEGYTCK